MDATLKYAVTPFSNNWQALQPLAAERMSFDHEIETGLRRLPQAKQMLLDMVPDEMGFELETVGGIGVLGWSSSGCIW
jgi:hypothetical protein